MAGSVFRLPAAGHPLAAPNAPYGCYSGTATPRIMLGMNEHRIAPRHRKLKAGTIEFGGGGIDCTVRNMSDTGAALEVVTPLFIPDRFTLFVPTDNFKKPCHIVWRKEKRIGVAFD